jgi:hypothetical protein
MINLIESIYCTNPTTKNLEVFFRGYINPNIINQNTLNDPTILQSIAHKLITEILKKQSPDF